MPYTASVDDYFDSLYTINQRYNFSKPFNYSASDTTQYSSGKGQYVEIADFDIGRLGRASLRVQGNISLQGKLVNQDQELVRSSYKEREQTNFKFDQKQQLNVQGDWRSSYNIFRSKISDFDWENTVRIDYEGKEDDILLRSRNISSLLPNQFVTFQTNRGFLVKQLYSLSCECNQYCIA